MRKATPAAKNKQAAPSTVFLYAVQCGKCFKWRLMPTQEEFEEIRSTFLEEPFVCEKKPNVTCEDPTDIQYDSTRTWLADKPNLQKTPTGFERGITLRKNSKRKMDVHFVAPTGKKLRGPSELATYLEQNPEYNGSVSEFSFTTPKIMADTLPESVDVTYIKSSHLPTVWKRLVQAQFLKIQEPTPPIDTDVPLPSFSSNWSSPT